MSMSYSWSLELLIFVGMFHTTNRGMFYKVNSADGFLKNKTWGRTKMAA